MTNHNKERYHERAVRDACANINRFWKRNLRNYFERWKDKLIEENKAVKIMDKYFSRNRVAKEA